jgi:hypothetical protein
MKKNIRHLSLAVVLYISIEVNIAVLSTLGAFVRQVLLMKWRMYTVSGYMALLAMGICIFLFGGAYLLFRSSFILPKMAHHMAGAAMYINAVTLIFLFTLLIHPSIPVGFK